MAHRRRVAQRMRLQFLHGEDLVSLNVERDGPAWKVTLPDGAERRILITREGETVLRMEEPLAGNDPASPEAVMKVWTVPAVTLTDGIHVSYGGSTYRFQPYAPGSAGRKAKTASGLLTAPMAGIVVDLLVSVGDRVEAYQPLAVIEAMKIMSTLEAPFAGIVKAIHTEAKRQIDHGAPVIEIAPLTEHQET
jgi:acetyl/propionyl-CoA carboxylase alpha subunit